MKKIIYSNDVDENSNTNRTVAPNIPILNFGIRFSSSWITPHCYTGWHKHEIQRTDLLIWKWRSGFMRYNGLTFWSGNDLQNLLDTKDWPSDLEMTFRTYEIQRTYLLFWQWPLGLWTWRGWQMLQTKIPSCFL